MNEIMNVNGNNLSIKEYEGQRVVTLWDIARLHGKDVKGIKNNFDRNIKYMVKNEDYFLVEKQSDFARTLSTTKDIDYHVINAIKDIPIFTESGYLMMTKPMTDDLSWKVQKVLVKSYFKLKEIAEAPQNENQTQSIDHLQKEQLQLEFVMKRLKLNPASEIKMITDFNKSQGLSTEYLPKYTEEEITMSASELLKDFGLELTTIKFNQLMIEYGYMEEKERPSTKGTKKYKVLTDKGLKYGKNLLSTQGSQKETQPHYYKNTFMELINFLSRAKGVI